ncbi:MAG: asparagine synthase (glutamine-hydrolyzing) [Mariprofundales bacterium]
MCGIVGIINWQHECVDIEKLKRATTTLRRRGPDDSGLWSEENIGFGHRRLAVIDTSNGGHQPMLSICGRYMIVFNGEIYNHQELRTQLPVQRWQSQSDTETILAAYHYWGTDCVLHFNGMFALAIWDKQDKKLFVARDRMGIKPLYYSNSDKCFVLASRPKSLLEFINCAGQYDMQGIRYYLQSGYFPNTSSVYKNVHKLAAGHWMLVNNAQLTIERYWDFRGIEIEQKWQSRSQSKLIDELDGIINKSVSARMLADVPLGAFLSGGIDSSLVVAYMCRLSSKPVRTFTIGFNESDYDESKHAQAVAEHLGTEHHCQYLNVNDLLELMPLFSEEYDEPFFDSSSFPTMAVSRLARKNVTVSLSGDGGDELFGGYHYYRIAEQLSPFFAMPNSMRKLISICSSCMPNHQFKLLAAALREEDSAAAFAFARSIAKDFGGLLLPDALADTEDMRTMFSRTARSFPENITAGERGARLDAFFTLPDDFLQKVDLASMAFSLEAREPFLDQNVVEWAMRLPWTWKLRGKDNKYLLRQLAYRYVPQSILDRPKQGFGVPIDHWLRGPLHGWAQDLLHNTQLFSSLPLSQIRAQELFAIHNSGARNISALLWAVLMLLNFVAYAEDK